MASLKNTALGSGAYDDDTYCTLGCCSHPSCWDSHYRHHCGIRNYVPMSADACSLSGRKVKEDYHGLPTYKVCNMLDDYGESPSTRSSQNISNSSYMNRASRQTSDVNPPQTTPTSSPLRRVTLEDITGHASKRLFKTVEVQEVFDLEELQDDWDNTFITRPMYVWIPKMKKNKPKPVEPKSRVKQHIIPDAAALKDVTNAASAGGELRNISHKPRSKSPLPTGGQPYTNVGQTPKDRMRYRTIMNDLKGLPRPFIIEVLEKTRGMQNKEEVLLMMERYLKTIPKSDWEISLVTSEVLQHKTLDTKQVGRYDKLLRFAEPLGEVYKLDASQRHPLVEGSDIRPKYAPLPEIAAPVKKKPVKVHATTSTNELPKPFVYKKGKNPDFSLGPARTVSSAGTRPDSRISPTTAASRQNNDISVLYDAESLFRNQNTNNNNHQHLDPDVNSRDSSQLPKPPAGTPYTPNKPLRDWVEAYGTSDSTPEGALLEAIQEVHTVDEQRTHINGADTAPTTQQSALDHHVMVEQTMIRRVLSAELPRVRMDYDTESPPPGVNRLINSAKVSLAVVEVTSSVGQADQIPERFSAMSYQKQSRLGMQSAASNWPVVDEQLYMNQGPDLADPSRKRQSSAPAIKDYKERQKRPITQPLSQQDIKAKDILASQFDVQKNAPAPPPPSPEAERAVDEGMDIELGKGVGEGASATIRHPPSTVSNADAEATSASPKSSPRAAYSVPTQNTLQALEAPGVMSTPVQEYAENLSVQPHPPLNILEELPAKLELGLHLDTERAPSALKPDVTVPDTKGCGEDGILPGTETDEVKGIPQERNDPIQLETVEDAAYLADDLANVMALTNTDDQGGLAG